MYDVIIIGSGVAGSYIGQQLSKDYDILVIDNNINQIKDSGIVSANIKQFLKPPILKQIKKMEIISPSGSHVSISGEKPFAYILKRNKFSNMLRKNLHIVNEKFRFADFFNDYVHVWTDESDYSAKMIIDSSGTTSSLHTKLFGPQNFVFGIFNKGKAFRGNIKIFFNKYFSPDFFSWEIPANGEHGLITGRNIADYFSYYQKSLEFKQGYKEVHPIPIGVSKSFYHRCLFVGDSCGQVKPITGGGIVFSMTAGDIAVKNINYAFEHDDFSLLKNYENEWHHVLLKEIKRQLLLRRFYNRLTNKQIDDFFDILPDKIDIFDYDKLSNIIWRLPKLKLLKFLITSFIR